MSFYNDYYKYFLWNKGLVDHFFTKSKREVLLYVDNQLLEEIGKIKGISAEDYTQDFLSCVEHFCANYNYYICPKSEPNADKVCQHTDCKYYSTNPYSCLKSNDRLDVLAVANHISSKRIRYYEKYKDEDGHIRIRKSDGKHATTYDIPFFAIVIYVILKFDNGTTQEWRNVGKNIAPRSMHYILELWKRIHDYCERFDPDASMYDSNNREYNDYAGRILYHLPLSATTRNKILDAIFKSGAWKWSNSKTFPELIGLIENSLMDIKANEELRNMLHACYSQNDYNGISARKVQTVIDDFDIDVYESNLEERKRSADYRNTKISGEFALGIHFPDDENSECSIVLLTTVQQSVNEKGFCIKEEKSDSNLDGYNTSFVRFSGSKSVELKNYSLVNSRYNITPINTGKVIFFYEYNKDLFIQTRMLKPAKSYIIAVQKGEENNFEAWCKNNGNSPVQWKEEDTCDLFGNAWIVVFNDGKLNGQYYSLQRNLAGVAVPSEIVMKGGIKHSGNTYLINALPYFELPVDCKQNDIKVYLNLNGKCLQEDDDYSCIFVSNKLIVDIKDMPILTTERAYIDVCIEYEGTNRFCDSINVCGQAICYDSSHSYKYDRFGLATDDVNAVYWGNNIADNHYREDVRGVYEIALKSFESISDELYFTNLVAACCYSTEHYDITHAKFCKCVSYAATRLNIDIQKEGFISNVKQMLSNAGILNVDYSTRKCQAIAPSFHRVPFSKNHVQGTQLYMLTGCYTRAFVADLLEFCEIHNVGIFSMKSTYQRDEEKLLPPVILVEYNFSPEDFCKEYGQQCDMTGNCDFSLSLLRIIPTFEEISAKFHFKHCNSDLFLRGLEPVFGENYPRIRKEQRLKIPRNRYIEKQDRNFAKIDNGMIAWASIYCHHEINRPMVILQKDGNKVYLPMALKLPNYVERALYLMNLGMPRIQKVFVCGSSGDTNYSLFNQYNLYDNTRCKMLASMLTGADINEPNNIVRYGVCSKMKMELYRSYLNGKKYVDMYLVLKDAIGILAIAHNHKVYLNHNGIFYRMESKTINEAMTFLIRESWAFAPGGQSIGFAKGGGTTFETVIRLTNEILETPSFSNFNKESIIIL